MIDNLFLLLVVVAGSIGAAMITFKIGLFVDLIVSLRCLVILFLHWSIVVCLLNITGHQEIVMNVLFDGEHQWVYLLGFVTMIIPYVNRVCVAAPVFCILVGVTVVKICWS